jgi:hypothetical protein
MGEGRGEVKPGFGATGVRAWRGLTPGQTLVYPRGQSEPWHFFFIAVGAPPRPTVGNVRPRVPFRLGVGRVGVRRPPLVVVLVAVFVIALGETAGAVMSQLRSPVDRYARARVAANPAAHGLAGSAEYDSEVTARTLYTAEAGLSFLHTHAQGLGPLVLFAGTVAASALRWRRARGIVHVLVGVGGLFPLGYLVYALASLELGRERGVELAERYVLTPLGSAMIVGLLLLAGMIVADRATRRAG